MGSFVPLATVSRGGLVESTHLGDVALCNAAGRLIASIGDPGRLCYYRSSGKPLQALGVVTSGAADRFSLTATELSVCCASHSGSRLHVATVAGILEKLGLDETALNCGVHEPGDAEERRRLAHEGLAASPLHNNCSGKHAGMLATALALGAPTEGYLNRDHPVQQLIDQNLETMTGMPCQLFHYGADGCGAPVVAVPLQAIAISYARLANPQDLPGALRAACERIVEAMALAPDLVSAPGAFNSELLAAGEGRLAAKGGAEGLFALGLKDPRHLGLAVKTSDGSNRPHPPIVLNLLEQLGGVSPGGRQRLEAFYRPDICNCHGQIVGTIESTVELDLP